MSLSCYFTAIQSPYLSGTCTGLGNVLFQISSVYGLAKRTGKTPNFWPISILNKNLKTLTDLDYSKTIYRNVPCQTSEAPMGLVTIPHNYRDDFNQDIIDYINGTNVSDLCLQGHFESHIFFKDYEEEIRNMFQPDPESMEYIKIKYPFLFSDCPCVSIHIRNFHTSFKDDRDYIRRALEYVPANCQYVVISNDIENVRKDLSFLKGQVYYIEGNPDYIDMWVMSLCRYNILSHSTMSWWGAFLNLNSDKTVVCPSTMQKIYPGPISNFYFKDYILV